MWKILKRGRCKGLYIFVFPLRRDKEEGNDVMNGQLTVNILDLIKF